MRHSTTLPHEYYGDAEFPEVLRGLVDAAPPLPPDWSPKQTRPAQDIELPPVEEDMSDDVDAALEAETKNELAPRGDQLLANQMIGKRVRIAGTVIDGDFESWHRKNGIIITQVRLETGGYIDARLDDLELVSETIRAGVDLARDPEDSVVIVGAGQARIDDSTLTAEHGPGVSISVSTPDGEPLGSWRTFEDGTHVVDQLPPDAAELQERADAEGWENDGKGGVTVQYPPLRGPSHEEVLHVGDILASALTGKPQKMELRACRICGCTDDQACEGGCYWVEADLCSACLNPPTELKSVNDIPDPDWVKGTPPPPGINPVPEVDPAEVAEQKEKGTNKLIAADKEFKQWKKWVLPELLQELDRGYGPEHRMFTSLSEDQLAEVRRARPNW